ncbi:type II secretion system protein [Vibrio sinensis]|uniref:Type II secretion system protein n=1 Tax=Vibrio sinensis TaxID=2302434 RepID=A0A3A6QPT7_9VIBR|nr:type II secretion system protein [Vibrio sinensis]RJX70685.1 type II secretion system protein [Vibrio sinensis]
MHRTKAFGFTLVELIVVILLLAIISLFAASRYSGLGSFSALVAQDNAIAVLRQVQVSRMQSNSLPANNNFIVAIKNNCIGSVAACNLSTDAAASRSDWVSFDDVTFQATPNLTTVEFDLLGNPLNTASAGVEIAIRGTKSQASICIHPNGYISQGGC